ncbi:MAG: hypothetical protein II622_02775, partial [Thermoguttaceae bacterium]|nr:hypothetical protein [Thermoguttaceae bacterium]
MDRIRRFFLPSLRRPFPVFLVPTVLSVYDSLSKPARKPRRRNVIKRRNRRDMRNAGPALTRATNSDEIGTLEAIGIYSVLQYIEKSVSEKGVARKILTCRQNFLSRF